MTQAQQQPASTTTAGALRGPLDGVRVRGATTEVEDTIGTYCVPNAPFQMPGLHAAPRRHVPTLGEHTESVLAELAGAEARAAERPCHAGLDPASTAQ